LARAKNTNRAEARRRHRDQQRVEDAVIVTDTTAVAAASDAGPSLGTAMRRSLRMPDVMGDLRGLPQMILHTRKLWIPFIALFLAFIVALMLPRSTEIFLFPGIQGVITGRSMFPEGTERIAALFVQLTLPPTALFIFFIGGFLAPRASYLVGATLGLVDGILWSLYVFISQTDTGTGTKAASLTDGIAIILIAVVIGTLGAGFAAWYRNFLRQSQERAKANRAAREAQMRAKAKEDERLAREEQRKAAAAAREAAKATSKGSTSKSSTSKGTPPAS